MTNPDSSQTQAGQLEFLACASRAFAESLDINETLGNTITRFMEYLEAEAASIFLLDDDEQKLVCRACAGPVDIQGLELDSRHGIVGKTVREDTAQIVRDVQNDPDFNVAVDDDTGFVTRSVLCTPLTVNDSRLGVLELINKRCGDGLFTEEDRALAAVLASAAALAIRNARMAEALVEQERIRAELAMAGDIQRNLLPDEDDGDMPVTGVNLPAHEVSGDFYDFLKLEDGRIYFCLGDVSGKGVNAALLMAKTISIMRCLARTDPSPGALLALVNDEVHETSARGMFVTVVAGLYCPSTDNVRLANAGHQPPLLRSRDGAFSEITDSSVPLGIMRGSRYGETCLNLEGGSMYLLSDGVTESRNLDGEEFGLDGLMTLIDRHESALPKERLSAILDHIAPRDRPRHDDITLLLLGSPEISGI